MKAFLYLAKLNSVAWDWDNENLKLTSIYKVQFTQVDDDIYLLVCSKVGS